MALNYKLSETSRKTTGTSLRKQLHVKERLCCKCGFKTRFRYYMDSHRDFVHGNGPTSKGAGNIIKDDENIVLLHYVRKLQLYKYYESVDTIQKELTNKLMDVMRIFKKEGCNRGSVELEKFFLNMRYDSMWRFKSYYIQKSAARPTKEDYILANLFPKFYESVGFDMSQLMADAKTYSTEIVEYLGPVEDQERPSILEDTSSLCHLNDVEPQPNLKRPCSEEDEGPANKITKEVHEDEDVRHKRMLDITRGRNNYEAATSESSTNDNNSSTDDINNALKAKLLVAEKQLKEKADELERKNLEISYLKELHKNQNNSSTDEINTLKAKLLVAEKQLREKDHELDRKNLEISYLKELHANELEIEKIKLLFY
ncbi:uncharacterized protein LOC126882422 [Diabrotica virgifera virgifera]|uniref:Uncharacterized protein n=1 Tax=Diabrotica virgifera virgifera TaxID=50390 RepID=A0ABM5JZH0_DIAVI|nr:uncharacterized protein LOC126882422 [Diabrotica virgifera virgifera]